MSKLQDGLVSMGQQDHPAVYSFYKGPFTFCADICVILSGKEVARSPPGNYNGGKGV